jgi:translation initiation factor 1 (eIF-1/SUI1)
MPELTAILIAKREKDYDDKKFLASIQGIDLEGKSSDRGQKEWEDMKARVFSGGTVKDSNDIVSLQGNTAKTAGFGIGNGLEYSSINAKNPMR